MRKILVCDNHFNVESISSCSKIDSSVKFYEKNGSMSFYDNFDRIGPQCVWINKAFETLDNYDIKNIPVPIIEYNIPYIIPNSIAQNNYDVENIISCILFNDTDLMQDRIYEYDDMYVRFYSISDHNFSHSQYCGKINTCKDLTEIILRSKKILIDSYILKNICFYYDKEYAIFNPREKISWISSPINTITNTELFLSNENR